MDIGERFLIRSFLSPAQAHRCKGKRRDQPQSQSGTEVYFPYSSKFE